MSVIDLPQWQALAAHTTPTLRALFAADPARGDQLVAEGAGLMLDYSKQRVTAQTRDSIIVVTGENTKIVWGSADSSSLKGQVADTLTTAQPACAVVDVSSPTHPTTRC